MVMTLRESFLKLINIHARLGVEMPLFFVAHTRQRVRLMRTCQAILDVFDQTSDALCFGGSGGGHGFSTKLDPSGSRAERFKWGR